MERWNTEALRERAKMGLLTGYSEPHEIADAYFARLEEERERLLRNVTCSDCNHYTAAPDKWVRRPCGYCSECEEVVEGDVIVAEFGCESFEGWGQA